jgi:hypothetical protein
MLTELKLERISLKRLTTEVEKLVASSTIKLTALPSSRRKRRSKEGELAQ